MCLPRQMFKKVALQKHLHLHGILRLCWFTAGSAANSNEADKADKYSI